MDKEIYKKNGNSNGNECRMDVENRFQIKICSLEQFEIERERERKFKPKIQTKIQMIQFDSVRPELWLVNRNLRNSIFFSFRSTTTKKQQ